MDGVTAWGAHPVRTPQFMGEFPAAAAHVHAELRDGPEVAYRDCHAWMFTPAGFSLIMLELGELGLVEWHIDTLHGPEGCEFFVFLRRGRAPALPAEVLRMRRMELLRQQLIEMREQIDFAIAGAFIPPGTVAPAPAASLPVAGDLPAMELQVARMSQVVAGYDVRLSEIERVVGRITTAARPFRGLLKFLRII
jgi:hypothetical protein